jgi:ABC-type phosphate/phosphonate transport system substrate-binding protein
MHRIKMVVALSLAITLFTAIAVLAQTTIKVGVASMITPVSAVKYYQQVVDYLGGKLGMPAEMVHRTTYDEIDVMLEEKKLNLAFICFWEKRWWSL